jgi:hypothetical protein
MNKNIDIVPTYPKYPTNSFENDDYVKMVSNTNTLDTSTIHEPVKTASSHVTNTIVTNPVVSIFALSYIEYLGMIGICVFIIIIVTEFQIEYEDRKQSYLIKTNAKPPTLVEIFQNMKINFINNITSLFNNYIEYIKTKYEELKHRYNKWKVNSHLENKTLKTVDISYYKDKYK